MTFLILSSLAWLFILYLSIWAWADVTYSVIERDFKENWGVVELVFTALFIIFPLIYAVVLGIEWYAFFQ